MLPSRRLRLHAVALVTAGWGALLWAHAVAGPFDRFGQLRGMDFAQFYGAGRFVAEARAAELYDWEAFARALPQMVPSIGDLLYLPVYPPQVALAFALLGGLSYFGALILWTLCSAGLYAVAVAVLLRQLPALGRLRSEMWAFAAGFPPFLQLLAHGQIAALALILQVVAFVGFRKGRNFWVGLALGSLAFKPQLWTFVVAAFVLCPSRALVAGAAWAGIGQFVLVAAVLGPEIVWQYGEAAMRVLKQPEAFEPKPWAMHSLRGTFELLLGRGAIATAAWMSASGLALWLARRAWRSVHDVRVRFAVLAVAALLVNPHLYVYDLVLLVVPLALLGAWLVDRHDSSDILVGRLVYSLVWLPLLGPLAAMTHVQPTAPVMVGLLWAVGTAPSRATATGGTG